MKITKMNGLQLSNFLHNEIAKDSLDHDVANVIMQAYAQISGFYHEHAVCALKHFQEHCVLILSISELNKIMKEEHYVF